MFCVPVNISLLLICPLFAEKSAGIGGRWMVREIIWLTFHVFAGRYFLFNVFIMTYELLYASH